MSLILAADAIDQYLSGESFLLDGDGNRVVTDEMIQQQIDNLTAFAEAILGVSLTARRYAAAPHLPTATPLVIGDDYDEVVDLHPWVARVSTLNGGRIVLRHRPVTSIQRIRAIWNQQVLYTLPSNWVTFNRQSGTIEISPTSMGEDIADLLTAHDSLLNSVRLYGGEKTANFWAVDYTAGLTNLNGHFLAVLDWIVWNAFARVLAVAAVKHNPSAVSNQSVSKDGVSRSFGQSDSQPGGRFSRLLEQDSIKKMLGREYLDSLAPHIVNHFRVF